MTVLETLEKIMKWYEKNKGKAYYNWTEEAKKNIVISVKDMEELREILGIEEEEKDIY